MLLHIFNHVGFFQKPDGQTLNKKLNTSKNLFSSKTSLFLPINTLKNKIKLSKIDLKKEVIKSKRIIILLLLFITFNIIARD